jgi:hypothetical protein
MSRIEGPAHAGAFAAHDGAAHVDAFVADENSAGSAGKLLNFVLGLSAERAVKLSHDDFLSG